MFARMEWVMDNSMAEGISLMLMPRNLQWPCRLIMI